MSAHIEPLPRASWERGKGHFRRRKDHGEAKVTAAREDSVLRNRRHGDSAMVTAPSLKYAKERWGGGEKEKLRLWVGEKTGRELKRRRYVCVCG